jgi:hypothetical protein
LISLPSTRELGGSPARLLYLPSRLRPAKIARVRSKIQASICGGSLLREQTAKISLIREVA